MPFEMIYSGHRDTVFALAWSPDGKYIASGSRDKTVQIWDAASGRYEYIYRGHSNYLLSVAWRPDGPSSSPYYLSPRQDEETYIASGCTAGIVQVWHAFSGENLITYRGHKRFVRSLAWSPDGRYIASGGDYGDSTVQVWSAATGDTIYTHDSQYRIFAAKWSPVGPSSSPRYSPRIASGSFDATIQVWDAFDGRNTLIYKEHTGPLYTLAWSPDGRYIVSGGEDALVRVWNATTGKTVSIYKGHTRPVKAVAWSSDGKHIASGGNDATVQVWNSVTGERIVKYDRHNAGVRTLDWSPNGVFIASASDDTVHVWQVDTPA